MVLYFSLGLNSTLGVIEHCMLCAFEWMAWMADTEMAELPFGLLAIVIVEVDRELIDVEITSAGDGLDWVDTKRVDVSILQG